MLFTDADAAALYDVLNPWDGRRWPADAWYDALVLAAGSVLDVGCGSGAMLDRARRCGHPGRLAGIDPDRDALALARLRCPDVEWICGRASDLRWAAEFELVTMASNAFQCLVGDEELRTSLTAIRRALVPGGMFAFDTRHPQARAWLAWTPEHAIDVRDAAGRLLRVAHQVESVDGEVVTFTETTSSAGHVLRVDRTRLRFLDEAALDALLTSCGFKIDQRYGDGGTGPVTPASRQLVTLARRT